MQERFMKVTEGVYGETERATYQARMRPATLLEQRRLSAQQFVYFLPFLPLAVCPDMPDVVREFCADQQRDVELVHWKLDVQLVPKLINRGIDTSVIFGMRPEDGLAMLNFANGIILPDEANQEAYRIMTESCKLIEPGVSLARPAEKILADQVTIHVLNVQSSQAGWRLVANEPPVDFRVVKLIQRDVYLCQIVRAFWTRGLRTRILG